MVDNFEVEPIFSKRQHQRYQFKLVIEGKYFKGDYHEGEIHWLNPHPKQILSDESLKSLENEVHTLLTEHGVQDLDEKGIEVEEMLTTKAQNKQIFKLKIKGEEFKGVFDDGKIEWFHPKPRFKLEDETVEKIEEKVHEKMDDYHNKS